MSNWWNIPENERTEVQQARARRAYYKTLLAEPEGRQVHADMRRRSRNCENDAKLIAESSDFAIGIIFLDEFMRNTRVLCGPVDEVAVLEAEAIIARREPEKKEEEQIEGYSKDA